MATDVTGSFELRKLLVKFSRAPAGGTSEDQDVITMHFAKITAGAIDANWLTADFTGMETRLDTWWNTFLSWYPTETMLAEYRWSKDGPVFSPADRADGPANPSVRTTLRAVTGSSGAQICLPPQCAATVTKITSERKRWGRVYMPAWDSSITDVSGRIPNAFVDGLTGAFVTLFNGCRAAGIRPVVFSRERSAHTARSGGTIAAHPATAYEITSVQTDNLFDVVQSRRLGGPTRRTRTALT